MKLRGVPGILAVLLVVAIFSCVVRANAQTASSGEIREQINTLEAQQSALEEEMAVLEEQLLQNVSDMEDTVKQKNLIDEQIFLLHEQLLNTNEQIAAFGVLIADKQEALEQVQDRYDALHEAYKTRIRAMEEQGSLSYWSVLFQANSFSDLLDRLNMIQEIADADNRRLRELNDAAKAVEVAADALETEKAALEQVRAELEQTRQTLDEKRAAADALLQQLLAQGQSYALLLEESEQRQEELMQQIAQMEVEYDEAVYQEWLATYVPPTTAPVQTTPPASIPNCNPDSGNWLTPVPYYTLSSTFGMRFHPILNIWRMHNGIDMGCAEGTEIYASRGGVVSVAAYQENGAGNYVQINHGDGYSSIYMHMTHYIVSAGDYVAAGQVIGYVGSTGLSKGNHLHFGISYDGTYVNPLEYLP